MNRKPLLVLALSASASALLLVGQARSQCTLAKLQEPASNPDDQFGVRVAIDGNILAIGEVGADKAGAVHVFVRTGLQFTHVQELLSPDAAPEQHFGAALALQGGRLLIGAPEHGEVSGPGPGTAYVFVLRDPGTPGNPLDDRFVLEATLQPESIPSPGLFGLAVALDGDIALVGAPVDFHQGSPLSSVFVFAHVDTWFEQARLQPPGAPTKTAFGRSLALLDSRTALVTDAYDLEGQSGACHVFVRDVHDTRSPLDDTWSLATALDAPADVFGELHFELHNSLAADGDLVACSGGQLYPGSPFPAEECVFVFERDTHGTDDPSDDTWGEPAQIQGTSGGSWDLFGFGFTIALSGQRLLLTLPMWTGYGPPIYGNHARTYVRVDGVWMIDHELTAPDEALGDLFGWESLVLEGDVALIGARGGPAVPGQLAVEGAAYVVDLAAAPAWQPLDVVHVFDATPDLAGWGSPTAGAPVAVRIYNSQHDGVPVALVIGAQRIDAPLKGQVLVPSPDLVLGLVIGSGGDVQLSGSWPLDVPSGATLWLQAWTDLAFDGWTASTGISVTQP